MTDKGRKLKSSLDFKTFRLAASLPKQMLHPELRETVLPAYLRGQYDMAVFGAFCEVEEAVRKASKSSDKVVGQCDATG